MPVFDGRNVSDVEDFTPIPVGRYKSQVIEIEEKKTGAGDDMWRVKFKVVEGEHANRHFYDNWVWSTKSENRIKMILHSFGFDTEKGQYNYTADMLKGLVALVELVIEPYTNKNDEVKDGNVVPYAGYQETEGVTRGISTNKEELKQEPVESDLPF